MPAAPWVLVPFDRHSAHLDAIAALYDRVWGGGSALVRRHAAYPGFKGLAALTPADQLAGFAYGSTVLPGQWWTERVAPLLGPERAERYFLGSFALGELIVAPEHRRRGLATRLIRGTLAGLPHTQATLSTQRDNHPARALYERLGFTYLIAEEGKPSVVMHRPLPLASAHPARTLPNTDAELPPPDDQDNTCYLSR